jgi:hypothetical protein
MIASTRIVCNPAGYPLRFGVRENKYWNPDMVIEI